MATMAMAALPQPPSQPTISFDSLTHIDITTLSQSELHALSLFSSSSSSFNHSDLVIPKIDRSVFNESAGSRRQTYSRPRRSQTDVSPTGHRRRVAGLHATPKLSPVPPDDPEHNENHAIIAHLKHFISQDPKFDQIDLELSPTPPFALVISPNRKTESGVFEGRGEMGVRKRKRGRKPKAKVLGLEGEGYVDMELVNKSGAAVDVSGLADVEDPFGQELRRRTAGLVGEEELLGFMRELSGQWGSRRKKRKIVDASEFGDALPVGWKLLLGLKRKEGRAWIYCRRYISPTGQQFLSCKEVSSFLQSFFGLNNAQRPDGHGGENVQEERIATTENQHADKDGDRRQDVNSSSTLLVPYMSNEREKEVNLLGMENLADVQIRDLFECRKCNLTFDEKDSYLQHLLSFHQRTTRRYRLGSTVGDGVIIKDGKYECQFCHKVFLERRRYNGHVGIHVRNYVRRVEELPGSTTIQKRIESPAREGLPSRISKMDALIEIAQNSILETSTAGPNDESKGGTAPDKPYMGLAPAIPASISHQEMNIESPLSEQDLEGCISDRIDSDQQDSEHTITDGSMEGADDPMEVVDVKMDSCLDTTFLSAKEKNVKASESSLEKDGLETSDELEKSGANKDGAPECHIHPSSNDEIICDVVDNANLNCSSALEHPNPVEVNNNKISEPEIDDGCQNPHGPANDTLIESIRQASEGNEIQSVVPDSSMSLMQPFFCVPTSNAISDKGEQHPSSVGPRHDHETGFEELRLDEIEPLKYGFEGGQESLPLQEEAPMDLTNNAEMERAFVSSVQFESEEVMLSMAGGHQLTTVCVWCGVEFNHEEAVDSEIQPDSVGFMCPACKAKTSGLSMC